MPATIREELGFGPQRFRPYPKYKDSGVEWLGEIPAHWKSNRLKNLCYRSALYGANEPGESYVDDGVRFLRTSDIDDEGRLLTEGAVFLPREKVREYILKSGDLLISRSGTLGRTLHYRRKLHGECAYAGYLVRFEPSNELCSQFAYYFTKSVSFQQWLSFSAIQSTIGNINGQKCANLSLPVPRIEEQRAIATFLDRETAKIDVLIAKKERLIKLLHEKRTALITQAVTKGLDPSVPMKDSGVEWLGAVPANWKVKMLKRLAFMRAGTAITSEEIESVGEYPVFGGNGIRGYTGSFTHDGVYPLVGRQGALCGCVNFVSGKFWASEHAVVAAPNASVDARWLTNLLQAMSLNSYSQSAAQPGLAVETIGAIRAPLPGIDEQRVIAAFLDRETARIDRLITKIREAIERLKEYRIALISAAVTGKICVLSETH